ncbi:MAG: STAS domain-containing protein [Acidobacteriota bacterium]|nr:STAS domain-containing protein [Acidobacteriota bacterium]
MTMTTVPAYLEIDADQVSESLQRVCEKLTASHDDVCLDFANVRRIGPDSLKVMEKLAGLAEEKAVKASLRGVNVNVYRVLKLARLTSRFSFLS